MPVLELTKPTFPITKNSLYRIYEKVDGATPNGLKEIRRYKMVGNTIEPARCLYVGNPDNGRYDTGFYEDSVDFRGMETAAVKKILDGRKELKKHYEERLAQYLKRNPTHSETEFLSSDQAGIELSHGMIIDTSSIDKYLRLYLAFRGGQITPSNDISNPKYNSSLYTITKVTNDAEETVSTFDKEAKVITWYSNNKDDKDTFQDIIKTLQYVGALAYGRTATQTVISNLLKNWMKDISNLDELIRVIDEVPIEEIYVKTKISQLIYKRVITKDGNQYYYKGTALGTGNQQIYNFITDSRNDSLLDQIRSEA